jgi:hypothetical protein
MTTAAASATALPVYSPTDTIVPAAATETLEPSNATLAAEMGSMGVLMKNPMPQFLHPVGEPLKSWHDVPVMPQATAGQEFNANVYSYIATASLAQAGQFYSSKAASLGLTTPPATGFGGSGSNAEHDMMFSSFSLTIVLTSFDNDTGHVIAVIAKVP